MIDFGNRLYGRYAAEDINGHVKRNELITRYIDEAAVLREKNEQQRLSLLEQQMRKELSHGAPSGRRR